MLWPWGVLGLLWGPVSSVRPVMPEVEGGFPGALGAGRSVVGAAGWPQQSPVLLFKTDMLMSPCCSFQIYAWVADLQKLFPSLFKDKQH